jgi:hypothetical protein
VAVASGMLARSTQREQHETLGSRVYELAAHRRTNPHHTVESKDMLGALDEQGQLTFEHEINLILALVRVYSPPLAGLKHDQVHPKSAYAQLTAQRLKTLVAIAIERGEGDVGVGVGHHASIEPRAARTGEVILRFLRCANEFDRDWNCVRCGVLTLRCANEFIWDWNCVQRGVLTHNALQAGNGRPCGEPSGEILGCLVAVVHTVVTDDAHVAMSSAHGLALDPSIGFLVATPG